MKSTFDISKCFWLPPGYYNTCVSGANPNTIKCLDRNNYLSEGVIYFENYVLPSIKDIIKTYPSEVRNLPKSKLYGDDFRRVVNEALKDIRANKIGYVYSSIR